MIDTDIVTDNEKTALKDKTVKGLGWSFADNISNSGITFLIGIILARILTPAEFGLIGMLTIFIAVSNNIVDSGFSSALIRKAKATSVDYSTVFYLNMCFAIILYLLLYQSAPFISRFFDQPLLKPLLRVLGIILIFSAVGLIQKTLLVKKVDFKTQTKISIISSISSGIIGVLMAMKGYGVWSIVGQQLSRQIVSSIFLWLFSKWRPALQFSVDSFKNLFGFGSRLLISSLIDTVYRNVYYLIVGRFYSASELGQYTRADQFNQIFSSNLTGVMQKVSYPILCSIQEDDDRLQKVYQRLLKSTMLVSFACMLGLAAIAKSLILVLIGIKWLPSVAYLQILCFGGMLYPIHAMNLNILIVKGRSDLFLRLEVIKKVISVVPILLGVFYGIEIMLWGGVVISVIAYFLNSQYSEMLIGYSSWSQLKDVYPSFIVSALVSLIMWGISALNVSDVVILSLQIVTGLILAILVYENLRLNEYFEMKKVLISRINRLK